MKKPLFFVFLVFLVTTTSQASTSFSEKSDQFDQFIGTYVGNSFEHLKGPQSECEITVTKDSNNNISIKMTDSVGISFLRRNAEDGRIFDETLLPEYSYPQISTRELINKGTVYAEGFSHHIERKSVRYRQYWSVNAVNLDTNKGYIQITYSKSERWSVYNSTVEYVSHLNGCYDLKKVE